jgi:hypothetical protein
MEGEPDKGARDARANEPDVRVALLRINGGVTSAVLRNATEGLKGLLFGAFEQFKASGHRSEAELQIKLGSSTDLERRSLRIGAPKDYNMKCYSMAFPPATAADFLSSGSGDGIECVTNMLMWMYNENANATRYNTPGTAPASRSSVGVRVWIDGVGDHDRLCARARCSSSDPLHMHVNMTTQVQR